MGNLKSKLTELVDLYVEEDGGGPMTTSSVGSVGQSEADVFTVPKSVSYPDHKEPATSEKRKKKDYKSFMSLIAGNSRINEKKEKETTPPKFASSISNSVVKKVFGDHEVYNFDDDSYVVKFYRKNKAHTYGKMYFIGNQGYAIRLNRKLDSKNDVDSVSIWNKWTVKIANNDLDFGVKPDGDIITTGLTVERALELAKQVGENRDTKLVKLKNVRIEKDSKEASKQFTADLKERGKEVVDYMELLDIADDLGYNVIEPGDGSLDITLNVPMEIPDKEYLIPYESEYGNFTGNQKMITDGELSINAINIQSFVNTKMAAEKLLNYFDNLNKEKLIDDLSIESVIFAAKVVNSKHPNWLNLLIPKLR